MKPVFVPNYYARFSCIASACAHSCCIGWEIDVDADALARYGAVTGHMGERLRAGIDREADPPCFILDEGERCPFLNQSGLCDLITELGEDALCRICVDHPRFRNVQYDRVEVGLGLCCEAAGALILGQIEPMTLVELPAAEAAREKAARQDVEPDDPFTQVMRRLREEYIGTVQDRRLPLGARARRICPADGADLPKDYAAWANFLRALERLDPAWDAYLDALSALRDDPAVELDTETDPAYEQLLCYFLYRYMAAEDDGRMCPHRVRVAFAVLSTVLIHAIVRATGGREQATLVEIARRYSSEVEYSEENVERFFDLLEEAFAVE